VTRQQLTLGQLVAAELIVAPVVASFAKFGKYLETFYDLLAAVDKVGNLFDLPLIRSEGKGQATLGQEARPLSLRFRRVGLSAGTPHGRELQLDIPAGKRVAILGPHGSGKSFLLDVALGLRAPATGAVELDGIDLRELSTEVVRDRVALVRSVEIFDGTVLENVQLGRTNASLNEVRQALSSVGLLDAIANLPEGLGTRLSGGHSGLSTGQAHQLMLARALLHKPCLLALDESLDALDPGVRTQIVDLFLAAQSPWTLLLATHLPELAERCDVIIRLQNGVWAEARS